MDVPRERDPWSLPIGALPDAYAHHGVVETRAGVHALLARLAVERLDVVLVSDRGVTHALTRGDLERLLPSPATALARYEIPELLRRVSVRHALRVPAVTVSAATSLADAVRVLRETGWRPAVVLNGVDVAGVITAESVLGALARLAPAGSGAGGVLAAAG